MNIETLLPLILKGGNSDMLKIVTALKCGDKSKAIESIMPKNEKTEQLVSLMKMAEKKALRDGIFCHRELCFQRNIGYAY